jgi:putative CocE/NonD family hydrolase
MLRTGLLIALLAASAAAQELPFQTDEAALAAQALAVYQDTNRETFLDNRFRLELLAGRSREALKIIAELRSLRAGKTPAARAINVQYEILARAGQHRSKGSFARAFRGAVRPLDDRTAALVLRSFNVDRQGQMQAAESARQKQKGKSTISLADAVALLRAVQADGAYRVFGELAPALIAEDDARRYVVQREVLVPAADGASVCALIFRPRKGRSRLPALFEFVIYADQFRIDQARLAAAHGYIGIEAFTRGKLCSPGPVIPYEHDGKDAAAVIDWIAARPFSDGRVGMYGGSYSGFTPWAAAKHHPKGLKAILSSASAVPGIDVPMEGNVFQTFVYYWPFYAASNKTIDSAALRDQARWDKLQHDWYVSGKPYRALSTFDSAPNPIFDRWLEHPSYDGYWQAMTAYGDDFAGIDIPVLTTTGYFDGAQIGALYYFMEHTRLHPGAEHYLVVGPYDHFSCQQGPFSVLGNARASLRGYGLDPVALVDINELRYQWFDYIFKGTPRPALLEDKVNYEVMGENRWRHVPTLAAMGAKTLRFNFDAGRSGDFYRLREGASDAFISQRVELADRSDASRVSPASGDIIDPHLDTWNSVAFVSEPFAAPAELSGLFAGQLDFVANKQDFDFQLQLYEQTPKGDYFELSYYLQRASYAKDRSRRELLEPGKRQQLSFRSGRLTGRLFQAGSRLVAVLTVVKQAGAQINYGTGKDVSDESVASAGEPLVLQWFSSSYLEVPVTPASSPEPAAR